MIDIPDNKETHFIELILDEYRNGSFTKEEALIGIFDQFRTFKGFNWPNLILGILMGLAFAWVAQCILL
jgi:hypothetical protein